MALQIQEMVGSEYLAGLWRSNLLEDLLWSSAPDLKDPLKVAPLLDYRAPSWSWASVDSQIRFEDGPSDDDRCLVKVLSAQCETSSNNYPLGEVVSGKIKLRGPTLPGALLAPKKLEFYYKLRLGGPAAVDVFPDTLLVAVPVTTDGHQEYKVRRACPGEKYCFFKVSVICIAFKDNSIEGIISGLVLSPTQNQNRFERLGTFSCGRELFANAQIRDVSII